ADGQPDGTGNVFPFGFSFQIWAGRGGDVLRFVAVEAILRGDPHAAEGCSLARANDNQVAGAAARFVVDERLRRRDVVHEVREIRPAGWEILVVDGCRERVLRIGRLLDEQRLVVRVLPRVPEFLSDSLAFPEAAEVEAEDVVAVFREVGG